MSPSILSLVPYGSRVPFGDIVSHKAAAVNFALTAGFVALQPAFQDLAHTFLDIEVHSASLTLMKAASAMFSSNQSGSAFVYKPPTPTTQSFESSTGNGPLIGAIACATFSAVGAAIALSGRSRPSAGSSSACSDEGEDTPGGETPDLPAGDSGEDPAPPEDPSSDAAQSEGDEFDDARSDTIGGSGPPPPPPPPSFNATDAGDAADRLVVNDIDLFGFLLLMGYALTSGAIPFQSNLKAMTSGDRKYMTAPKPTNSTTTTDVDDLFQYATVTSLSLDAPPALAENKIMVEPELADASKHLVSANETSSPLPCLDIVKPVLPTTCPNIIPVEAKLADASKHLVCANEMSLPLPCLDVIKPVLLTTCPNIIPFLVEAKLADASGRLVCANDMSLPFPCLEPAVPTTRSNMIPSAAASILWDAVASPPALEEVQIPPVVTGVPRHVPQWKSIIYGSVLALIYPLAFVAAYISAIKILTKKAPTVEGSTPIIDQQLQVQVPDTIEDSVIEEPTGSGFVLQDEDGLAELEQKVYVGEGKVENQNPNETERYEEIMAFLSTLGEGTVVSEDEVTTCVIQVAQDGVEAEVKAKEARSVKVEVIEEVPEGEISEVKVFNTTAVQQLEVSNIVDDSNNCEESAGNDPVLEHEDTLVEREQTVDSGHKIKDCDETGQAEEMLGFLSPIAMISFGANIVVIELGEGDVGVKIEDVELDVEDETAKAGAEVEQDKGLNSTIEDDKTSINHSTIAVEEEITVVNIEEHVRFDDVVKAERKDEVLSEIGNISQEIEDGCREEVSIKADKRKRGEINSERQPVTNITIETREEGPSVSTGGITGIRPPAVPGLNSKASAFNPNFRPRILRTEDVRSLFERIVQCDADQPPQPIPTYTTTSYRKSARKHRRY